MSAAFLPASMSLLLLSVSNMPTESTTIAAFKPVVSFIVSIKSFIKNLTSLIRPIRKYFNFSRSTPNFS